MKICRISDFPFDEVSSKIKSGLKLRLDIGTSQTAPFTTKWHSFLKDIITISIEPNPNCESTVYQKTKDIEHHYHIVGAVDNVDVLTIQKFYLMTKDPGCSSLLQPILTNPGFFGYSVDKIIDVETFPLKMLLENIDYQLLELLKTDTQGKDLDVVKSLGTHIDNVCYVDIEDDHSSFYENASKNQEIVDFFKTSQFDLYQTIKHDSNGILQDLRFCNKKIIIPKKYNNKSIWRE